MTSSQDLMKSVMEELMRSDISRIDLLFNSITKVVEKLKPDDVAMFEYKGFSPKDFVANLAKIYINDYKQFARHTAVICLLFAKRGTKVRKILQSVSEKGEKEIREIMSKTGLDDKIINKNSITIARWASSFFTVTAGLMRDHAGSLTHEICDHALLPTWCATPSIISLFSSNTLIPFVFRRVAFALCWLYNHYLSDYLKTVSKSQVTVGENQTATILLASMKSGLLTGGVAVKEIVRLGLVKKSENVMRSWGQTRVIFIEAGPKRTANACTVTGDENLQWLMEKLKYENVRKYKELMIGLDKLAGDYNVFIDGTALRSSTKDNWKFTDQREKSTHGFIDMSKIFPNSDLTKDLTKPQTTAAPGSSFSEDHDMMGGPSGGEYSGLSMGVPGFGSQEDLVKGGRKGASVTSQMSSHSMHGDEHEETIPGRRKEATDSEEEEETVEMTESEKQKKEDEDRLKELQDRPP